MPLLFGSFRAMKSFFGILSATCALFYSSCSPTGRLATPEQNIAPRFEVAGDSSRRSWTWSEAGSPAVLSLERDGAFELTWAIREKPYADRRRTSIASLLQAPPIPAQGPLGLKEIRFSPSGRTILVHEAGRDRSKFQTLIFRTDPTSGAWTSRKIDLGSERETKLTKLDDKTKVPAIIAAPTPPRILRLDDELVIYETDGKTRSQSL